MGIKVDTRELQAFRDKLKNVASNRVPIFMSDATKHLANMLLAVVIPRTPVGNYSGGGTLRRGWSENNDVSGMSVERGGGGYSITITNPVYYASYVENGHRQKPGRYVPAIGKRLVKSWVAGKHFLRQAEEDVSGAAPAELQVLLDNFLGSVF